MTKPLLNLFRTQDTAATAPMPASASPVQLQSSDSIQKGETYVNYGKRICGLVTASMQALQVYLQKVYNYEKQRQINDEELQEQKKADLQRQLNQEQAALGVIQNNLQLNQTQTNQIQDKINDLKQQVVEAKHGTVDENKMARLKMILGITILLPLTFYLFIFYSSTFYSAFFRKFADGEISVGAAIFDPNAIPAAYAGGLTEIFFILCAPIIFLGLGFALHFFSVQKNRSKYLKITAVLAITLIFDCILAYLIAKNIYDAQALNTLAEQPPFSKEMALHDMNVWAVIFCGFIVYIIWGIVFDMTTTAYEDTKSNHKIIAALQLKIDNETQKLHDKQIEATNLQSQITKAKAKIKSLEESLNKSVHYDVSIIQTAINDFYSGWVAMMAALGHSAAKQDEANSIYQTTIGILFPAASQPQALPSPQQA